MRINLTGIITLALILALIGAVFGFKGIIAGLLAGFAIKAATAFIAFVLLVIGIMYSNRK